MKRIEKILALENELPVDYADRVGDFVSLNYKD